MPKTDKDGLRTDDLAGKMIRKTLSYPARVSTTSLGQKPPTRSYTISLEMTPSTARPRLLISPIARKKNMLLSRQHGISHLMPHLQTISMDTGTRVPNKATSN